MLSLEEVCWDVVVGGALETEVDVFEVVGLGGGGGEEVVVGVGEGGS